MPATIWQITFPPNLSLCNSLIVEQGLDDHPQHKFLFTSGVALQVTAWSKCFVADHLIETN